MQLTTSRSLSVRVSIPAVGEGLVADERSGARQGVEDGRSTGCGRRDL